MNEIRNIMVGFDLGIERSQICYYDRKADEPISIPVKVGTSEYEFPTVLCKKAGEKLWHYGIEAEYFRDKEEYIDVPSLYALANDTKSVNIDEKSYEPYELIGEYLKAALSLLGVSQPIDQIGGIVITTKKLTRNLVLNLRKACQYMGFGLGEFLIQDYDESFYYHTFCQKKEIWNRRVGLFTFEKNQVTYKDLTLHAKSHPMNVQLQKGKGVNLSDEPKKRDEEFLTFANEMLNSHIYSSIFIMGDGFDQSWAINSVGLLCKNHRKVFQGTNLFAKGACYAAKERMEDHNLKGYLYEGEDLIHTNISMDMVVQGTDATYPIIKAGVNWYEAVKEFELILDDKNELVFVVQDFEQNKRNRYKMSLKGLPDRPKKTTRLSVRVEFEAVDLCKFVVTDLGFGELFESSGLVFTETLKL